MGLSYILTIWLTLFIIKKIFNHRHDDEVFDSKRKILATIIYSLFSVFIYVVISLLIFLLKIFVFFQDSKSIHISGEALGAEFGLSIISGIILIFIISLFYIPKQIQKNHSEQSSIL